VVEGWANGPSAAHPSRWNPVELSNADATGNRRLAAR
ncbi:MAG: hypothetical protein QOF44_4486, partial [Streptomyces sp.]|nr:hypothetical protein [Streptomyces sp.]